MIDLTQSLAWQALEAHLPQILYRHLRDLLAEDPGRATRYTASAAGWRLDYARHRVTDRTLALLFALARERGVEARRDAMFRGEVVNPTEHRAALHVALRAPADTRIEVEGEDVVPLVQEVLSKMVLAARRIRAGEWLGFNGRPIRNIVNIGIGGSDLGPAMAFEALRHYSARQLNFRFVSNIDAADLEEALLHLNPDETLFIVASKTFTTLETMTNAHSARNWLLRAAGGNRAVIADHFVALSTNAGAVARFGITPERTFGFWDWVGGRYSLDSAIGLSTMIAIGPDNFRELLDGFHAMDQHFATAPLEENLPVILGLLDLWYNNFFDAQTVAVLPYANYLKRFPAYLQQLTMESNGKQVSLSGKRVAYNTGPVLWGEPGTNGQHSFFQLLHQGTRLIPCHLIGFAKALTPLGKHQDLLVTNLIAQAEALAMGRTLAEVEGSGEAPDLAPHKVMEGNRPSSLLLAESLTPATLGGLIALYEHAVLVQSTIWDINPFDQWGVELGKELARKVADEISATAPVLAHDSATNATIEWYRASRKRGRPRAAQRRRVLVLDVGGSHVKACLSNQAGEARFASGPEMTPEQLLAGARRRLKGWRYDVVSIGFPALVVDGRIANQPVNLGKGWMGFDFEQAFRCPVRVLNDAAMQALGSYQGGRMLFLGLGTGLGTAMINHGKLEPMELAHLPWQRSTYEHYVGQAALHRLGRRRWSAQVQQMLAALQDALKPDYIVLGGGNVRLLRTLPPSVRRGANSNAFVGGFRLWEDPA